MALLIIFIIALIISGYLFGARTIGLFISMAGFAMFVVSPVLAIGMIILGVFLFIGIRRSR